MVDDRIRKYYLLCSVRNGHKRHMVNNVPDIVFTKKETELFLRKQDNYYVAKELIVGGGSVSHQILMI